MILKNGSIKKKITILFLFCFIQRLENGQNKTIVASFPWILLHLMQRWQNSRDKSHITDEDTGCNMSLIFEPAEY